MTWIPPSRYLRTFWILIRTCFSSLPLDAGTPTRYSKVRATAEGEGRHFRWGLWNTGISSRLPSLQYLLSIFSRRGWRKFGQKPFPISPTDWALISPFPYPPHPTCTPPIDSFFGAAFELGRHEWSALRRLITNSRSSAFTGSFFLNCFLKETSQEDRRIKNWTMQRLLHRTLRLRYSPTGERRMNFQETQ